MDDLAKIKIGTCAWSFDDWRGVFYPQHLPTAQWLAFYSKHFTAVEVDSTFYHAPAPHVAAHWRDVTPDDFVFAPKMPREITHERKLRESEALLEEFVASLTPLKPKLGCVLIQLPPYFTLEHDEHALREFIHRLPRDVRFAVEFRGRAWHLPRVIHLLEQHRVCWAWTDFSDVEHAAEAAFEFLPRTTDFLYLRILGNLDTKYRADGGRQFHYRKLMWPRDRSVESWVEKTRAALPNVERVFACLSNHFEGFAPASARRFAERMGMELPQPMPESTPSAPSQQLELL